MKITDKVKEMIYMMVYGLCLLTGFLIVYAAVYPAVTDTWWYRPLNDSVFLYLGLLALLGAVIYVAAVIFRKLRNKKLIVWLILFLNFGLSVLFVFINKADIVADQLYVFNFAIDSLNGDYWGIFKGEYIGSFPYQLGLVALQSLILKFCSFFKPYLLYDSYTCIRVLRIANCLFSLITNIYALKIIERLGNNDTSKFLFVSLVSLFTPLYIYNSFVYNDIPSLCMSIVAMFYFIVFCQNQRIRDILLAILFISLAVIVRLNSIIFAIAFALILLYYSLFGEKPGRIRNLVLSVLLIFIPLMATKLPVKYYEKASNYYEIVSADEYRLDEGCPFIANIAMGIYYDDSFGWYNGFNLYTYANVCNFDTACATKKSQERIAEVADEMASDPARAARFFVMKQATQWGDGTLSSLHENSGLYIDLSNSNIIVNCFMKAVVILISVGSLLAALQKKEKKQILSLLLEIIVLGGFLFSLFWEAKSRYNLAYYYLMIINAAIGYTAVLKDPETH